MQGGHFLTSPRYRTLTPTLSRRRAREPKLRGSRVGQRTYLLVRLPRPSAGEGRGEGPAPSFVVGANEIAEKRQGSTCRWIISYSSLSSRLLPMCMSEVE